MKNVYSFTKRTNRGLIDTPQQLKTQKWILLTTVTQANPMFFPFVHNYVIEIEGVEESVHSVKMYKMRK